MQSPVPCRKADAHRSGSASGRAAQLPADPKTGRLCGTSDEAEVLKLDDTWNEAYRQRDRSRLAVVLADDFTGVTGAGEPVTKTSLMVQPPAELTRSPLATRR